MLLHAAQQLAFETQEERGVFVAQALRPRRTRLEVGQRLRAGFVFVAEVTEVGVEVEQPPRPLLDLLEPLAHEPQGHLHGRRSVVRLAHWIRLERSVVIRREEHRWTGVPGGSSKPVSYGCIGWLPPCLARWTE